MGKIIAIVNQKGGVGKTTTSINLSASLGILGKRVLMIDLDPQGNATTGVGIDKRVIDSSIYKFFIWVWPPNIFVISVVFRPIATDTKIAWFWKLF